MASVNSSIPAKAGRGRGSFTCHPRPRQGHQPLGKVQDQRAVLLQIGERGDIRGVEVGRHDAELLFEAQIGNELAVANFEDFAMRRLPLVKTDDRKAPDIRMAGALVVVLLSIVGWGTEKVPAFPRSVLAVAGNVPQRFKSQALSFFAAVPNGPSW